MDIKKELHIFTNKEQMADYAASQWKDISRDAIERNGLYSAALSGGNTPVPLYEKLAGDKDLPWQKTHIFMVDERFVPYGSSENNYHMINRTLLLHVSIAPKNIHPILTTDFSPQTSADRYEEDVLSFCKNTGTDIPRFDMILLGIGEDGHTASLFPGSPALKEKNRLAVCVTPADRTNKERITLTLPVLNNGRNIIFLASGKGKAKVIKEVIKNKDSILPAAQIRPAEGRVQFILDQAAGSLI